MRSSEERLDRVFGALADRTRRRMVARLAKAPASISELAAPFEMSLPAASKHVRVLERAGLVKRTIDGRVHTCALDGARLRDAAAWIEHYETFWSETLDALAELVGRD